MAIEASRGCAYACNFCSIPACQRLAGEARRRRLRDPHAVACEMATIVDTFCLKDFWFMDADVLGPPGQRKHTLARARAIAKLPRDITLEIDARADSIPPEIIRAFQAAGLKRCFVGVDSFDGPTLTRLAKGTPPETNLRAIETLQYHGVRPIIGIIMFHPASTLGQLRKDHHVLRSIGYEKPICSSG
ncbi:B12-binding domain-containing radical SAM protein [Desulfocurvus vexinensis]|uniref:B12-binding domain-containing radical SAM protein n=1 Tax=Desulfocurvus vexinensis TaxID=399548 RepID=UPI00048E6E87|nr:radical SAM protein [Desulfocurvus vexinensis]